MNHLTPGQVDKVHNKTVKTVAIDASDFCVFIDTNNEIFYTVFDSNFKYPPDFNKLNSKIRRLEILVLHNLDKRNQSNYNYLLANNLAEALEETTIKRSWEDLSNIEKDINELVNNTQKKYFTYGTILSFFLILVLILTIYLLKGYLTSFITPSAYQVLFASLFGGIGAIVFNYSKLRKYSMNRVIGRFYNFLDGFVRVFYGSIYALIIIVGIKAGMLMNFINSNSDSLMLLAFVGIIAGASDTFIPAIIKSIESKSTKETPTQ